ncbi:hypothetical protein IEU95_15785 [Hoyosella rhizosphaerae]|uniref:Uncharacterized protein n=1 Tax=Hoyosella rhizosphaerae TaxID=1755582 RepID=A0A916UIR1_9ACTN|nr:hypothetical protein [Hoyosella rhizosphaerae]MBN4928296.1 hypothetical protein [Hoyosella rhizosphaerae]GGC73891.1 hypothetical protein GCM10011410_28830 [Hoyosella rhizosphaerae]
MSELCLDPDEIRNYANRMEVLAREATLAVEYLNRHLQVEAHQAGVLFEIARLEAVRVADSTVPNHQEIVNLSRSSADGLGKTADRYTDSHSRATACITSVGSSLQAVDTSGDR